MDDERRWRAIGPPLVFAALTIGITWAGWAYQRGQERQIRRSVEDELSAVASSKAAHIAAWRAERLGDAQLSVATSLTSRPARAVLTGEATPGARAELASLYQRLVDSYGYRSVCLVDQLGQVLLRAGGDCASRLHVPPLVARSLASGQVVLSELVPDPSSGELHLGIVAPLREGATPGAVVLRMDARDFLVPLLAEWPTARSTGRVRLLRRDGGETIDLSVPLPGAPAAALPVAREALRSEQPVLGRGGPGEAVLAVARPVSGTPWFVLAQLDVAEIEGPARRSAWSVALTVGSLILGAALILTLAWRRQARRLADARRDLEEQMGAARLRSLERHVNEIELIMRPDGSLVEANDRAVAAYGYGREELRAMNIRDLHPEATRGAVEKRVAEIGAQGWGRFELEHRRRDGSLFPVEVSARTFRAAGETYHHALVHDLTERKRAEAGLRLAEEHRRLALEGSGAWFWDWDLVTRQLHVDARWAQAQGAGSGALEVPAGTLPALLVCEEDQPLVRERFTDCLGAAGGACESEHRVRTPSGELVWVRVRGKVVDRRPEGTPTRLAGTIADVTVAKGLQQRLVLAERMASIGHLAGSMAHEINNPLACILSNVRYALDRLEPAPAELRDAWLAWDGEGLEDPVQALREAADGARRVRDIVAQLWRLSTSGGVALGRTDVRQAVSQALAVAGGELEQRAEVANEVPHSLAVEANAANLVQVFAALLVNAAEAPGGAPNRLRITAQAMTEPGRIAIQFSDRGKGIAPEALPRTFDPFFSTKSSAGRGLSLAVCHAIVKSLGGEIEVSSAPGEGTTFRVILSAAPEPCPAPDPREEATPLAARTPPGP